MISVDYIMNALEHSKVQLPFFLIHPVFGDVLFFISGIVELAGNKK